ncbi:MAG: efflux RND transporter periplasmic adaptor subunit [Candidatus Marinimicrobia bacterium]|jgi:RND family efflux transporter MFP subunit|nr:efflux RND transporter periplasmic adaptor subunit [Candidatus Neomarinimicrobiota bacterium]MBT3943877.1 efflux RND transporter periplasmic adaptor subunit [Candidatus Neomarinimicrobiota bacterium]MBT4111927.1 efflux RND transporter periplasmic adaptor subunit [Candidatus Neomarinimicrobiota bacterium]MBT4317283.1 efflux RND transporter periplasmic adaptor subunit [Candidatus Neomarinimicrobiota bacterium]MBT4706369.1 efflux RND transporter periplasmic adaptor subunit [Candidatus Neomarini
MIKYLKPLLIIGISTVIASVLYMLGQVSPLPVQEQPPLDVNVQILAPIDYQIKIKSTGTTTPITKTVLTSEVGGEVIYRSKKFSEGSSVISGEILAKIDDTDLQLQYKNALLQLASAEVQFAVQQAEAEIAQEAWEQVGEGTAKDLTTKKPQLKQAKAALEVAKAQVQSSEKKLNKTEITAPYTGRIQNINIDLGSTIVPGQPVGSIYTSNEIEVTLSVKDSDLQFLDIPMDGRKLNPDQKSIVIIKSLYKGEMQQWAGNLERVDGVIDPMTRMIKLIANFKNNFIEETKPILPIGLFVEAEINGKQLEDMFMIPNTALTPNDELLVLNQDDALEIRKIKVVTKMKNYILVKEGVKAGERVVVSKLSIITNGMLVNPRYQ